MLNIALHKCTFVLPSYTFLHWKKNTRTHHTLKLYWSSIHGLLDKHDNLILCSPVLFHLRVELQRKAVRSPCEVFNCSFVFQTLSVTWDRASCIQCIGIVNIYTVYIWMHIKINTLKKNKQWSRCASLSSLKNIFAHLPQRIWSKAMKLWLEALLQTSYRQRLLAERYRLKIGAASLQ